MDAIRPISPDDLIFWPDGTYCHRSELAGYTWMSDDYEVIPVGSERWHAEVEQ